MNDARSVESASPRRSRRRHLYSSIGLALGFLAVGLAAFETHLVASTPQKVDERSLGQLATEASKRIIKEKLLHEAPPPPREQRFHPVRVSYTLLGLIAMGLGLFSWIRREHIRMSGGAAALGLLAVCWQWVLIGVLVAVVIFVLANIYA